MIELQNIVKKYNNRTVLNNISYSFSDVGLYIIKGNNGEGKTTLLNIIALLNTNFSGDVFYDGKSFKTSNSKIKCDFRNKHISYLMPSNNHLSFTKFKDLKLEINHFEILKKINFNDNVYIENLSGGEKSIISLLTLINEKKELILLDEITSQLDDYFCEFAMSLFKELAKESLVILATHDSRVLERFDDFILILEEGKLYDKHK